MKKYILAIDQGTGSSRAMLVDFNGTPLAQEQQSITSSYPQPAWVEQDPEAIWQTVYNCCKKLLEKRQLSARNIACIGIANQRETSILWHRQTGKPIYPAIVWQDRRGAELCTDLKTEKVHTSIHKKTGLLIDPYFSATKICWLLDNIPHARAQAATGELAFGTIDSYLLWCLTGGSIHATDASNASRTLLFNIVTQQWDKELLDFFQIPAAILPTVHDNCFPFGKTHRDLFGAEIPITALIGDQQAALVGQACLNPGMIKTTYGTGAFVLANTGKNLIYSKNNLLSTVAYRINNEVCYGLEGSIFNAGTIVKWLRDNLHLIHDVHELEQQLHHTNSTNGVYFVPAFTGLGAPYWDPLARGAIVGLTSDTEAKHIIRAGLEAISYQTQDLLNAMEGDGFISADRMRVDGGMSKNNWLLQFLADTLNLNIERPEYIENTALGAAYLAGLGAGLFHSLNEVTGFWQPEACFSPKNEATQLRAQRYLEWQHAVRRATCL